MRPLALAVLVLALTAPTVSHAWGPRSSSAPSRRPAVARTPETARVTGAGEFTGRLDGTLVVDGVSYVMAPDAAIFEVGRGPLPRGTWVAHRRISIAGTLKGSTRVAERIVVRPWSGGLGDPRALSVADPARPR